jgi:hypothetical protein
MKVRQDARQVQRVAPVDVMNGKSFEPTNPEVITL